MPRAPKPILVEGRGISKRFGDFEANADVSVALREGEIHALLGENGAGKSTFVKLLYGVMQPDEGEFFWQGKAARIASPRQARLMGIAMVFQHFSLFPSLSVLENIVLASDDEKASGASIESRIDELVERWGFEIDPEQRVGELSVGEKQRVEVIRCLLQRPRLLIMDEPTSVLTPQESERLFSVLEQLAIEGTAIIYISHKLAEVERLAMRATVLRGGRKIGEVNPREVGVNALAEMMVGSDITASHSKRKPKSKTKAKPIFEVKGLNRRASHDFAVALKDINFALHQGEIIGIAGVSGNGQSELAEALSGEWRPHKNQTPQASMQFNGQDITYLKPTERRSIGIESVPEERNNHATIASMALKENTFLTRFRHYANNNFLSRFIVNPNQAENETDSIIAKNDVRCPYPNPLAEDLSGGNLQKFIIGRMLQARPKLAVVMQPSWGVDVSATKTIHQNLLSLAAEGCAIILISQDLEEILSLADRIAVIHQGRLSPLAPTANMTPEKIGLLMGGEGGETKEAKA